MLTELAAGATEPQALAELAKGRLRNKIKELEAALTGTVDEHHRFILAKQLGHIDFLDEQIEELNQEISRHLERMASPPGPAEPNSAPSEPGSESEPRPPLRWSQAVELLDTIPGVDRRTAEVILAETGLEMSQFPTADDLVSWAGFAPGNHQSGGKRYSGRMTKGNRPISAALNQAAWAASRTKDTFLRARFQRLVPRRGKKRAIGAICVHR